MDLSSVRVHVVKVRVVVFVAEIFEGLGVMVTISVAAGLVRVSESGITLVVATV